MSLLRYALVTVPLVLLLGTLSGRIANSGYGNPWFDALDKPALMPPGAVFGIAWTILYILLGLALAMILHARGARGRGLAIGLFVAQLLINYAWSPLFFAMHKVGLALAMILHARGARGRGLAIGLFVAQLLINYAWSPLFFAMHKVGPALTMIVVMIILSAVTALLFARIRRTAGLLMLPYLAWLCFAAYLNYQIDALNPDAERLVPSEASADIPL
jgi:tryptophan-rich sensory protein